MGRLAPINDQQLLATIATFPPDLRNNDSKRAFELAGSIVEYFFGQEWIDKHVSPKCTTGEYLRVIPGEGQATGTSTFKIVDFAELLYNLQNVAGFHICIDRLRSGVIEPTYAELDLGRMLYSGDVDFRFVEPQKTKGLDYDIEITLSEWVVLRRRQMQGRSESAENPFMVHLKSRTSSFDRHPAQPERVADHADRGERHRGGGDDWRQ